LIVSSLPSSLFTIIVMANLKIALLLMTTLMSASYAYYPDIKDAFARDDILRDMLIDALATNDASEEYDEDSPMSLMNDQLPPLDFMTRSQKDQTERMMDYDSILERTNPHPSLRDQEHMQHSSLWGYQFMSGGAGEGGFWDKN
jgi:hypothetical protein